MIASADAELIYVMCWLMLQELCGFYCGIGPGDAMGRKCHGLYVLVGAVAMHMKRGDLAKCTAPLEGRDILFTAECFGTMGISLFII